MFQPEQLLNYIGTTEFYSVFFGVMFLCGVGLINTDLILLSIGPFVAMGKVDIILTLIIILFTMLVGESFVFLLGKKYGSKIFKLNWMKKIYKPEKVKKTELMVEKHGVKFIWLACLIPGSRTITILVLGVFKESYTKFLAHNCISLFIKSLVLIYFSSYLTGFFLS